jgi:hypothetical protein
MFQARLIGRHRLQKPSYNLRVNLCHWKSALLFLRRGFATRMHKMPVINCAQWKRA